MMYNAMSDAVMMSALMSRGGYYYGATPGRGNFFSGLILIMLIVGVTWLFLGSAGRRY